MKTLRILIGVLLCAVSLRAADSTIGNLNPITTVPGAYRMPWEDNGVQDYYITFDNLTNQILTGYAGKAYVDTAAFNSTNGWPWGALYLTPASSLNASNLSGLVQPANLANSGTPLATTFLNGNFQWSTPTGSGDVLAAGNNYMIGSNTFTQPVVSLALNSNSPAADEFPTAGWVRRLFNTGVFNYTTTNIDAVATNPGTTGQPIYTFAGTIPLPASRTYVAPNTGDYIGSVMTTNTFISLQGPIHISAYLATANGSGAASVSIHPEIYYSYDKTNWFGDWEAENQTLIRNLTNLYQFVVSFPTVNSTNSTGFYVQRRYKIGTASGATRCDVIFLVGTNGVSGTNDASHISFSGPTSASGNALLGNNQTFTGVNTFTQPINGHTYQTNALLYTNSVLQVIDFGVNTSYREGVFETNASFAWLSFTNTSATLAQTVVAWVRNTGGSPITFTAPANCHTIGVLNCTNVSELVFKCYGSQWTNLFSLPLW